MKAPHTRVLKKSRENALVPKLWHGMDLSAWWQLLRKGSFAISPSRVPTALAITLFAINNSLLGALQTLIYRKRVSETQIEQAPIFVIGHYRSGTTLLQELLCSDPRFTYPTTYECFSPHHFLLTERWFAPLLNWIVPAQRLADQVRQGMQRPQEDEAALCCLGLPSRYHRFAFPNRDLGTGVSPDLDHHSAETIRRWKQTLKRFLQQVTLRRPRRIVLKSPQHSCRIKHLAAIFPEARFVYIVRDPAIVFPSTVRLWKVIHESQSLQVPRHDGLQELVLDEFLEMHRLVERDSVALSPSLFCQVRYEDLVANPAGEMARVYAQLELDGFEAARGGIEDYLAQTSGYKTNRYELSEHEQSVIRQRWREFYELHGYR